MNVAADTNVLLRAVLNDDPIQSRLAHSLLKKAESVFIANTVLCEMAWVLSRGSHAPPDEVELAILAITTGQNVLVDRNALEAGLEMLRSGGDFADGIIAFEGARNGAEFVSFDRRAVRLARAQGLASREPA